MFAFKYVKANSKEICEEIPFLFFQKDADVSIFVEIQPNYLEKMRRYPNFSPWIPIALAKVYFFRVALTWRKNLFCI